MAAISLQSQHTKVRLKFDSHGNKRQEEVFSLWKDHTTTHILYGGAKGGGKSYLGCSLLTADALLYPGTAYAVVRKTRSDMIKGLIPSFNEVFLAYGIERKSWKWNNAHSFFEFDNGSRIYFIDGKYEPSDPIYMRFGGLQLTRAWVEEAGELSKEAISSMFAQCNRVLNDKYDLHPKILLTCNPANNHLKHDYWKPWQMGELPKYKAFVQALPQDNRKLAKGYVDHLLVSLNDAQKQRLLFGNWDYDDDPNALCDWDAINDVFTNEKVPDKGEKYISTDLAGRGRDRWVVCTWRGNTCRIVLSQKHSGAKEMEERIREIATQLDVPRSHIVSDSDGLGYYLGDYLKGIYEFHGAQRARDNKVYASLKAECAYKLAGLIQSRQLRILCPDADVEQVKAELSMLRSRDTNALDTRRDLISKDTMRQLLGGKSPDFLDAILMRMVFEIRPPARGLAFGTISRSLLR